MKREDTRFQIDQLRKENIVSALQSIALTFISELAYFLIIAIFNIRLSKPWALFSLLVPLAYFLYVVYSNRKRNLRIKELESK